MNPDQDRRDRGHAVTARLRLVVILVFTFVVLISASTPTEAYFGR